MEQPFLYPSMELMPSDDVMPAPNTGDVGYKDFYEAFISRFEHILCKDVETGKEEDVK